MRDKMTRRMILRHSIKCSLGAAISVGISGCGESDNKTIACSDPSALGRSEISMRNSLNYTDTSSDPDRTCQGCAFFTGNEPGGSCGRCEIVDGQVGSQAYCDSWSQRS